METQGLASELAKRLICKDTESVNNISLGQHHLAEFYDCCVNSINDVDVVRQAMVEAAKLANATIVTEVFHEFNPHGISGVVVIAESHFAIHSWPEHACVSVDLFTCSEKMDPAKAIEYLRQTFKAQRVQLQKINRAQIPAKLTDRAI